MVTERGDGIFTGRLAMRIRSRPDGRVAHRCGVERQQRVVRNRKIVERGDLHEEIMRMLAVDDRRSIRSLALLEELRIVAITDGCRLKREHGAHGELAGTELPLGHRHDPVC